MRVGKNATQGAAFVHQETPRSPVADEVVEEERLQVEDAERRAARYERKMAERRIAVEAHLRDGVVDRFDEVGAEAERGEVGRRAVIGEERLVVEPGFGGEPSQRGDGRGCVPEEAVDRIEERASQRRRRGRDGQRREAGEVVHELVDVEGAVGVDELEERGLGVAAVCRAVELSCDGDVVGWKGVGQGLARKTAEDGRDERGLPAELHSHQHAEVQAADRGRAQAEHSRC